jgi:hypothetical protein
MPIPVFQRMTATVLATFGGDSMLRGSEPCRVNIEHGIQVTGPDGMTVTERSIATIAASLDPKVGDALAHPDGNFRLDVETASNGYSKRFVLLPVSAPVP